MPFYVIEHLEKELYDWSFIEYKHISKIVGKKNLIFSNVSKGKNKLFEFGKVFRKSVRNFDLDLKKVCVLDPEAVSELKPKEAKNFSYFIFGGILGDNPPRKRTQEELTPFLKGSVVRNIGQKQMSTDNAVYVVKEIFNGKRISDIKFFDCATIKINDILETELPYNYVEIKGKPFMSKELIRLIKKKDSM